MNFDICEATLENAAEISTLTISLGYPVNECQTMEWLSVLLNSDNHCVLVALNNAHEVLGWIVVEKRMSLETGLKAEITGLVVSKKYRRFGVGQKLVSAAIIWAKQLKLPKVIVRSNIERQESHTFYKAIGFTLKKDSAQL